MTTRTIATADLDLNALDLLGFLEQHLGRGKDGLPNGEGTGQPDVYIKDDTGRTFARATFVCEALTDGSEVFNIVLSGEG